VLTRLDRTRRFTVAGRQVDAAVFEDKAFEDGKHVETALDYYAQADDGTVYYLGEDVDVYERGRVVGHPGAFRYGRDTSTLGIAMPARPRRGQRFTFERIPGRGSERNRVVSTSACVRTPAGVFRRALRIAGYLLPEREHETKYYARGVGLVAEFGGGGGVRLHSVR